MEQRLGTPQRLDTPPRRAIPVRPEPIPELRPVLAAEPRPGRIRRLELAAELLRERMGPLAPAAELQLELTREAQRAASPGAQEQALEVELRPMLAAGPGATLFRGKQFL